VPDTGCVTAEPSTFRAVIDATPCTLMTSAEAEPAVPSAGCFALVDAPVGRTEVFTFAKRPFVVSPRTRSQVVPLKHISIPAHGAVVGFDVVSASAAAACRTSEPDGLMSSATICVSTAVRSFVRTTEPPVPGSRVTLSAT
jgi:hypothetical protein